MHASRDHFILADGRWQGHHGIARFSAEILKRLKQTDIFTQGPSPLSLRNVVWQNYFLSRKQAYKIFFTPGFNPVLCAPLPFVFTIHDLIHLHQPDKGTITKKIFYEYYIKPAAKKAHRIITVSHYSKQMILEWTGISPDKIAVISNGVSDHFSLVGERYEPGFPYLLHVGSTKKHKNILRLITAFAQAKIDKKIKLILTGNFSDEIKALIKQYSLQDRIISVPQLSERELANYYRGALGLVFPSLYEGFGLPVLEAMASGIPVLTSTVTALPEVAGEAALLVDPYNLDAMKEGIEQLIQDHTLRSKLIKKGEVRAKLYDWNKSAEALQAILNESL